MIILDESLLIIHLKARVSLSELASQTIFQQLHNGHYKLVYYLNKYKFFSLTFPSTPLQEQRRKKCMLINVFKKQK